MHKRPASCLHIHWETRTRHYFSSMRRLLKNLSFILLSLLISATLAATVVVALVYPPKVSNTINHRHLSSRRNWIEESLVVPSAAAFTLCPIIIVNPPSPATAAQEDDEVEVGGSSNIVGHELPNDLRKFTALAPLGDATSTGSKLIGLSLEDIASRLSHDLVEGCTGKGGYFISGMFRLNIITTILYRRQETCKALTFLVANFSFPPCISGDISTEIFRDDCEFTDPTNTVSSLSKYQTALTILFNPDQSFVELVKPLEINVPKREITDRIRSGGVLKLPWNPRISTYER